MALIALAVAKAHLRITTATTSPLSDQDQDITRKMEAASDVILSYLKGRALSVSSITSTGGVATVTTATPHGLASLEDVSVRGALQAEYNGLMTVTVTGTTTFTYVVTGTPAATATGSIAISAPATWDETTVPPRVQSAVLLMLTHLDRWRGDDDDQTDEKVWTAIERLLMRDRDPALA